ncbi:hypothetical protein PCANB_002430 [Pneumocystis canis]|nr:hypothetical protein PCANB_002430 [Pneumocystis canis]
MASQQGQDELKEMNQFEEDYALEYMNMMQYISLENNHVEGFVPVLKKAFESGTEDELIDLWTKWAWQKRKEVQEICLEHYREFMESIDQLLNVRQAVLTLMDQLSSLNTDVQKNGSDLVAKVSLKNIGANLKQHLKRALVEARQVSQIMKDSVSMLQMCLKVLRLTNKIHEWIENKEFYRALRSLDELQMVHLKDILHLRFAQNIRDSIPYMKQRIQEAVITNLKEWLLTLRASSSKVGELAFQKTLERQKAWDQHIKKNPRLQSCEFNSPVEWVLNERNDFDVTCHNQVQIDFTCLFECLHIYDELGLHDEFRMNYENDRRIQKDLLVPHSLIIQNRDISPVYRLLQDIAGFVIIEKKSLNKIDTLRSVEEIDSLWDSLCDKLIESISNSIKNLDDPQLIQDIKSVILLFIQTIETYGYSMKKFPITLPFSQIYPLCCVDIRNFVNQYYKFAEGYYNHCHDIDDILKQILDELLIGHVKKKLIERLKSNNLVQVVQIIINLEHFENACDELDSLLLKIQASDKTSNLKLRAKSEFHDAIKDAEKRIFELVNSKIDDFLEIADYDWQAATKQKEPSSYLLEMVSYLTTLINSTLHNLPRSIKTFVYFQTLDHFASFIMQILLNKSPKKITENFIYNLDLDLRYLERFAENLGDPSISYADTFLEQRQSINFLMSETPEEYLNSDIQFKKYSRVKPQTAIVLLEKLILIETNKSSDEKRFSKIKSAENAINLLRNQRL